MHTTNRSPETTEARRWEDITAAMDIIWADTNAMAINEQTQVNVSRDESVQSEQPVFRDAVPAAVNKKAQLLSISQRVAVGAIVGFTAVVAMSGQAEAAPTKENSNAPIIRLNDKPLVTNGSVPIFEAPQASSVPEIIKSLVIPKAGQEKIATKSTPKTNLHPGQLSLLNGKNSTIKVGPVTAETKLAPTVEVQVKAPEKITPTAISAEGINLIVSFEGWSANIYNDDAGHATIGYGRKLHDGPRNGSEPAEFQQGISEERGKELLNEDLDRFEAAVARLVKVPLDQNQFDALVSFTFNHGEGALQKSTLLKQLNSGDYSDVPNQLNRYVYADGKRLEGLARRRVAEAELWSRSGNQKTAAEAAAAEKSRVEQEVNDLVSKLTFPASKIADPVRLAVPTKAKKPEPAVTVPALASSTLGAPLTPSIAAAERAIDSALALSSEQQIALLQVPPRWRDAAPRIDTASEARRSSRHKLIDAASSRLESSGVTTVEVRGIRIRSEAALKLANLLEAAEKDGFYLTSSPAGAHRSTEQQIELRKENGCPDIFESPASDCVVPTAKPTHSNHEADPNNPNKYAVDFGVRGVPITSVTDPASHWLDKNGPRFGFYPLNDEQLKRIEPWHRSGDGR